LPLMPENDSRQIINSPKLPARLPRLDRATKSPPTSDIDATLFA